MPAAIRAKARTQFSLAEDGIHARLVQPGEEFACPAELFAGLVVEGKVEEVKDALPLATAAMAASGVTRPTAPGRNVAATELPPEVASAVAAPPQNPPPVEDRKTPVHLPGMVIDADDRAARDLAVQSAAQGKEPSGDLAAEKPEAEAVLTAVKGEAPTYETKQEVPAPAGAGKPKPAPKK